MQPSPPKPRPTDEDGGFDQLLSQIRSHFVAIAESGQPLFRTSAENLFPIFLENLPKELRHHYLCSSCKHFLNHYGDLVVVTGDGSLGSALWHPTPDLPPAFSSVVSALRKHVDTSDITGVFYTKEETIGKPMTGEWNHLALPIPASRRHRSLVQTPGQLAAEKGQDLLTLIRGLDEFPEDRVMTALEHLTRGWLYRSDKAEAVVHWILGLHEMRKTVTDERRKTNLLWLAAAKAPAGYCHIRSSMIGSLLEDITAGHSPSAIKARWDEKMSPSQYMRAQAPPAAGNIAQAEKIITTLKAAGSLERRYAKLDDIQEFIWRPSDRKPETKGVFSHLVAKANGGSRAEQKVPKTLTWAEFQSTILPDAQRIEAQVPTSADRFMALVTAVHKEAPPILQWDQEDARNPVSWYYAAGIDAEIRKRVLQAGGTHEGCDIRASLLWNNRNDLDLHAHNPKGAHIYFGHKRNECGGWLDVDMNVSGNTTTPVENIRWTAGAASSGRYQFYVQNYRFHESDRSPTAFRLELEVNGDVYHYDGVISPKGQTGASSNVMVAEFDYLAGQRLSAPPKGMRRADLGGTWNLKAGQWAETLGIVFSPNLWGQGQGTQHGEHVFFLLEGCKDTAPGTGRGFFTETLRSEFRPIRSTLEAYAANATIAGAEEQGACGLGFSNQRPWDMTLRVTTSRGTHTYQISTWS